MTDALVSLRDVIEQGGSQCAAAIR